MKFSIKAWRVELGLTQEAFAKAVGVSKKTVSLWESGAVKPNLDKIEPICRVLGVSYDDIRWAI